LFTKFLAGASLLMSFHLGGHCRQGYYVTHCACLAFLHIIIMPTIPLLGLKLASIWATVR